MIVSFKILCKQVKEKKEIAKRDRQEKQRIEEEQEKEKEEIAERDRQEKQRIKEELEKEEEDIAERVHQLRLAANEEAKVSNVVDSSCKLTHYVLPIS